jgi:hypothetical protein
LARHGRRGKLTAVQGWDHWRVKMAWPHHTPRLFGKFASQAEAKKWIADHHWLTEQRKVGIPVRDLGLARQSRLDRDGGNRERA